MQRTKWTEIHPNRERIRWWWDNATPSQKRMGKGWYKKANKWCRDAASYHSIHLATVAGVVAALSPACPWPRNLEDAAAILEGDKHHLFTTYPKNVDKARRILKMDGHDPLDILGGSKVRSFYLLISNPKNKWDVCVDRHAARVATEYRFTSDDLPTRWLRTQYDNVSQAFRDVACDVGVLPHQLQAVTWLHYKDKGEGWA